VHPGASKCLAEFIEVLDGAVNTPASWRLGVGHRRLPGRTRALIFPPDLCERQEKTLLHAVAIRWILIGFSFGCQIFCEAGGDCAKAVEAAMKKIKTSPIANIAAMLCLCRGGSLVNIRSVLTHEIRANDTRHAVSSRGRVTTFYSACDGSPD
jgi:hypothetical protein